MLAAVPSTRADVLALFAYTVEIDDDLGFLGNNQRSEPELLECVLASLRGLLVGRA